MSIFIDRHTTLIVQGITGRDGSFHTKQMMEYGTRVVGGVTPGKGGQKFEGSVPVFNTVHEAVSATGANTSVIYVPPMYAADAMMDRDRGQLIACAQRLRDLLHHGFGHPLVRLVVEMSDRAAARLDARRAGERRDRSRVVRAHLVDDAVERQRFLAQEKCATGDRRNERDLVTGRELAIAVRVLLVHRIEQPRRLVPEPERRPHVGHRRRLHLALRPAGALAQAGEEAHGHGDHESPQS